MRSPARACTATRARRSRWCSPGRLDIHVGFERYELGPGDSIHFPSSLPHRYVNPTDEVARAVTVILHDGDRGPPPAARRA